MYSIGLDVGHSAVKISIGKSYEKPETIIFPAAACRAVAISDESESARAAKDTVIVDGKSYYIGDTALIQGGESVSTGLSEGWVHTPEYAALMVGAYSKAMRIAQDRSHAVIMGLPTNLYARQKQSLMELAKAYMPNANPIKIIPQPMGAYFEHVFTASGMPNGTVSNESWGVVEIGYYTTDIVLMMHGRWVEKASGGCSGMYVASTRLQKTLSDRGTSIDLFDAEQALRNRSIRYYGEKIDISKDVDDAIGLLADEIIDTAARLIDPYARKLDGVVIAGGGAHVMYGALKAKWPHAIMPTSPRLSVAEGMRRYGLMLQISSVLTKVES